MAPGRNQRSRRRSNRPKLKSIKLSFSDEKAAAFGGFAVLERLVLALGPWRHTRKTLPERRGGLLTARDYKPKFRQLGMDEEPKRLCSVGLSENAGIPFRYVEAFRQVQGMQWFVAI